MILFNGTFLLFLYGTMIGILGIFNNATASLLGLLAYEEYIGGSLRAIGIVMIILANARMWWPLLNARRKRTIFRE